MNNHIFKTTESSSVIRRSTAIACAVCMIMLQCFLLLPALSGQTYAAGGQLTLEGIATSYKGTDVKVTKTYTDSFDTSLADLLDRTGLPVDQMESVQIDGSDLPYDYGEVMIRKEGDSYLMIIGDEEPYQISKISFRMSSDYSPVHSVKIKSLGKLKQGAQKKLTYGKGYVVKGDKFFEREGFSDFIDKTVSGAKNVSYSKTSMSFTAGNAGTNVEIKIEATGGNSTSKSFSVVSKALEVSPTSIKLKVGEIKTITVKDGTGYISSNELIWSTSSGSVASVTSGTVRGLAKGTATITVKSTKSTSKGLTAKVRVTVEQLQTTSTTRSSYSGYHPYTPTTRPGSSLITRPSSGAAVITSTAPRPTETVSTVAPSFQTMQVKEVYLTPVAAEEYGDESEEVYYDDEGNMISEEEWEELYGEDETLDDESSEEDPDNGVSLPAAAGSAAMAVAACGAGAIGRVRKFHLDMGEIAAAATAVKSAAGDGKKSIKGALGKFRKK